MTSPQINFDPNLDYYATLGVPVEATSDAIKHAYRQLAKLYHPDLTGGDKAKEQRFKSVQRAYDVIGNAAVRRLYDESRAGVGAQRQRGTYDQPADDDVTGVADWFEQFFGAPRESSAVEPNDDVMADARARASDGSWLRVVGRDVHSDVRISFDRAIVGTTTAVATLDGEATIKIPPGTASGTKLRLRGKGASGRTPSGDHYVTVHIDVPNGNEMDEESQSLLAQLARRLRDRD